MANQAYPKILSQGPEEWNAWREANSSIQHPDLSAIDLRNINLYGANFQGAELGGAIFRGVDLRKADFAGASLCKADLSWATLYQAQLNGANLTEALLRGADLRRATLHDAILQQADLRDANLRAADLYQANLRGAMLASAVLVEANLTKADLTNCSVYGISAWENNLTEAKQEGLIITPPDQPTIHVDNLEIAQFIYLLLNNQKLRDVIRTVGQKGVLILGRFFPPERKDVLDKIRDRVRELGYLPMMFDFERATEKDFTETIKILAGLSLFVIVDITDPKSAPLELQATVPDYKIPFVPIIQKGQNPFAMFKDLIAYPWVIKPVRSYDSQETLVEMLEDAIIKPAIEKHNELVQIKAKDLEIEDIRKVSSE